MNQNIQQEPLYHEHRSKYQHARLRVLIGFDDWELIVSKRLLTGSRDEPAASRTKLGRVIHGTTPRPTMSNEDSEHALYRANAEYTTEYDSGIINHVPHAASIAHRTKIYPQKVKLNEAAQLQLPRYYNTRGVRTIREKNDPLSKIRGQMCLYTEKVPLRKKATLEQRDTLHLLAANQWQRTAQEPRLATVVSSTAKRPTAYIGRHLLTRLQLTHEHAVGLMNNERSLNVVQQKCWIIIQRSKRKRVAVKCLSSRARRAKRTGAGRFKINPCYVFDCQNDPYDPGVRSGNYFQAYESYMRASTQHRLFDMRKTNKNLWRRVSSNNQEARRPNDQ